MNQSWLERFRWWLCEKAGHPFRSIRWIHGGKMHFDCKGCGRIISEPLVKESEND